MRSVQFGLYAICLFFLFFFSFSFATVFFLTRTNDSDSFFLFFYRDFLCGIAEKGEGIIIFLIFYFHLLTKFSSSTFQPLLHFSLLDLFGITRLEWWHLFFLEICILFAFLLMPLSRSYWFWHFKVTLWGF